MNSLTQTLHFAAMRKQFRIDINDLARTLHVHWQEVLLWEEGAVIPSAEQAKAYQAAVMDAITRPRAEKLDTHRKTTHEQKRQLLHSMCQLGVKGRDIAALLGIPSHMVHNKFYGNFQLTRAECELIRLYLKQRKLSLMFGKERHDD